MNIMIFPIDGLSINILKQNGYKLDPTHVYWYKKINDDTEIEIQNCDNDMYYIGQVIIHCENATIIDDLSELKDILMLCERSDDNV